MSSFFSSLFLFKTLCTFVSRAVAYTSMDCKCRGACTACAGRDTARKATDSVSSFASNTETRHSVTAAFYRADRRGNVRSTKPKTGLGAA